MGSGSSSPASAPAAAASGRIVQFGSSGDLVGRSVFAAFSAARGSTNPFPLVLLVSSEAIDSFTATTGAPRSGFLGRRSPASFDFAPHALPLVLRWQPCCVSCGQRCFSAPTVSFSAYTSAAAAAHLSGDRRLRVSRGGRPRQGVAHFAMTTFGHVLIVGSEGGDIAMFDPATLRSVCAGWFQRAAGRSRIRPSRKRPVEALMLVLQTTQACTNAGCVCLAPA